MGIDLDKTLRELERGQLPDWIGQHLESYLGTGGAEGHLWDSTLAGGKGLVPCLVLTTVGRRTGEKRQSPLIYGTTGGAYVVVGSKGGAETHPSWYLNLLANPAVEVQVGPERFAARARVAAGDEREKLFAQMVEVFPPYRDYQNKTSRQIALVVLEKSSDVV